ncbi:hypothetical protein EAO72_39380 [Streptomyces sp. or43]|nr:hypothetical protein EAO72_39380 [Streptomyces sp. or43]
MQLGRFEQGPGFGEEAGSVEVASVESIAYCVEERASKVRGSEAAIVQRRDQEAGGLQRPGLAASRVSYMGHKRTMGLPGGNST